MAVSIQLPDPPSLRITIKGQKQVESSTGISGGGTAGVSRPASPSDNEKGNRGG